MALEATVSMESTLEMRISFTSTMDQGGCAWPMLDLTPMALSSTSLLWTAPGWMEHTPALARCYEAW